MEHRPRVDRNFVFLSVEAAFFSVAAVCFDAAIVLPVFIAQFTSAPLLIGAPAALRLPACTCPSSRRPSTYEGSSASRAS